MLPILTWKISYLPLVKCFETIKMTFYFLCNCIIRVGIHLTLFNILPVYLNDVNILKHISHKKHSVVFKRAQSTFCKCTMIIIRYICIRSFARPFQLSDANGLMIFCFVYLYHYVGLTDWGLV